MNFNQRLKYLFTGKASQARLAIAQFQQGVAQTTPVNYEQFSQQAYQKNVYAFRAISLVAKSCSGIKWEVFSKRVGGKPVEIESHPLLTLLEKPNPMMPQATFFENVVSYLLISGNSYIEKVPEVGPPLELWTLRPDQMRVVPGKNGYISQYIWKAGMVEKVWNVDPIKLTSPICQLKTFHPTNLYYGMSPIEAARLSLDQNNQGSLWNLGLLQNSATPSGVLQMKASDGNPSGQLTDEQYTKLRQEFYSSFAGSRNSGKPLILEGGLEWKQMAWNPKDMEFMNAKEITAEELCLAFGVPPMMLGLGEMTYSNYGEARESFYEETVLPLMDFIRDYLNLWLVPMFGDGIYLDYDRDDIEALQGKKERKRAGLVQANWLTINEKRQADGYEPKEGWDVFVIGSQILDDPETMEDEMEEDSNEQDQTSEMVDETEEEPEEPEAEIEAEGEKGFKGGPGSGGAREGAGRPAGSGSGGQDQHGGSLSYSSISGGGVSVGSNGQIKIKKPKTVEEASKQLDVMKSVLQAAIKDEEKNSSSDNVAIKVNSQLRLNHAKIQMSRAMGYAKKLINKKATSLDKLILKLQKLMDLFNLFPIYDDIDPKLEQQDFEDEKGFKAINLINGREKHQSWFKQNAMRERLAKTFKNDLKEDLKDMYKAMTSKAKGQDAKAIEFAVLREMEQHLPTIQKTIKRHIKRSATEFGDMILINAKSEFNISLMETKANLKFDTFVDRYIEQRSGRAISEIEGTTRKQVIKKVRDAVQAAIANGDTTFDLTKELQDDFVGLTEGRARLIARTEVAMASTQGSLEAVKSLGIPNMVKEWVPVEDDRTRDGDGPNLGSGPDHLSMKGVMVPLDENFTVPPDASMNGPGDSSAGADQVCNCRCVLVYKRRE